MRTKNKIVHLALCAGFFFGPLAASVRDDRRDCSGCFKSTLCDIKHRLEDLSACGESISIGQKEIGTTGYVIEKSGNYCLKENVVFNPANPATFVPVTFVGDGSGAAGFALVSTGVVQGVLMTANGSGYTTATPSFGNSFGGSGAAGSSVISGGSVAAVNVTSGGSGYRDTVQAAITVKASGVKISFGGNRLYQAGYTDGSSIPNFTGATNPSSQAPFVVGVLIPDLNPTSSNVNEVDLESIYIDGGQGIIDGFSMYGIRVFGHTADIQISNLSVQNSATLGSYYLRPFASYVPNGTPENAGQAPFGFAGIAVGESDIYGMGPIFFTQSRGEAQNRVTGIALQDVNCLESFFEAVNMANSSDVTIDGCHFDNTFDDDPNLYAIGLSLAEADVPYENPSLLNITVSNSTANNTTLRGDGETPSFNFYTLGSYFTNSLCQTTMKMSPFSPT